MDAPPSIPTSFVPRSLAAAQRAGVDPVGLFAIVGYTIFAIVFALAIGVFVYGRILTATFDAKEKLLAEREASIDSAVVEGFVRLHTRLESGRGLLAGHVAATRFFADLETVLPSLVRFGSMRLSIEDADRIKLEAVGVAKSFNTLAATSEAFARDGRIKDAIFSGIIVNKDSSVSFALSASVDPKLISFAP